MTVTLILIGVVTVDAAWVEDAAMDVIAAHRLALELDDGATQQAEFRLEPGVEGYLAGRWRFRLSGRFRADIADHLEPGQPGNGFRSAASERAFIGSTFDAELRDAWIEFELGDHYLRLGKQQIVWGEADGLKVLDALNPQSFREFILPEFDESRIALWSANLELALDADSMLQLVWLPDQTYDDIPDSDATYALSSPLLVPLAPAGTPVTLLPTQRPGAVIADSDIGLRYSRFVSGWEFSLNYLYHYVDRPVLERRISATGVTVQATYARSHLLGGSFNRAFGDWVARGELGYSTDKRWLSRSRNAAGGNDISDELAWVLGLDYQGITDTFLSVQLFQSALLDRDAGVTRNAVDNTVTFLAQRDFENETLTAELLAIHSLSDADGVLQFSLSYDWRSNVELRLGADVFYGREEGLFGQFADRDRVSLEVEFGF